MSEWLKVMLGEIARKQDEHAQAVEEQQSRAADSGAQDSADESAGAEPKT